MNNTPQNTDGLHRLLFKAGLLGLAATTLSSCILPECTACNGNGYVQLEGGAPLPMSSKPAAPKERIGWCPECDATGKMWGFGSVRAEKDIDRSKLKTLRVY